MQVKVKDSAGIDRTCESEKQLNLMPLGWCLLGKVTQSRQQHACEAMKAMKAMKAGCAGDSFRVQIWQHAKKLAAAAAAPAASEPEVSLTGHESDESDEGTKHRVGSDSSRERGLHVLILR